MKNLLLIIFLILSLSINSKNIIINGGYSPEFEKGLVNLNLATINNNIYTGLDVSFGTGKYVTYPVDYYKWIGYGNNIYLGYSIKNKLYFSGLIGYLQSNKTYKLGNIEDNILMLNFGGEIGMIFNNLVVSTSYTKPIGFTIKMGVLLNY